MSTYEFGGGGYTDIQTITGRSFKSASQLPTRTAFVFRSRSLQSGKRHSVVFQMKKGRPQEKVLCLPLDENPGCPSPCVFSLSWVPQNQPQRELIPVGGLDGFALPRRWGRRGGRELLSRCPTYSVCLPRLISHFCVAIQAPGRESHGSSQGQVSPLEPGRSGASGVSRGQTTVL